MEATKRELVEERKRRFAVEASRGNDFVNIARLEDEVERLVARIGALEAEKMVVAANIANVQ